MLQKNNADQSASNNAEMEGWQPYETAPKDGSLILIGWKYPEDEKMQEYFTMRWGHIQQNGLFPNAVGMWVAPDGGFTWNDNDKDGAPTHWKPK
jgi:hypothetical protein